MIPIETLRKMPKVELHVHLEGSIRPETLLKLARWHEISLPADDLPGLERWYTFRDFSHFVEVYIAISQCIRTPEDLELIAREFLAGQAAQNILHSEVTYTAATIEKHVGIPFDEQISALKRAMDYGREELGISMSLILDIVRGHSLDRAVQIAEWCVEAKEQGVCALGIAGEEWRGTAEYEPAYRLARECGLPVVAHAGETCGPEVIWDSLNVAQAVRIGHGVRCQEDPALVDELRKRQVPLEVCPSSNVCLGVFPSLVDHPIKQLLDQGLYVTLNSDDPPMFGTTLTDEFARVSETFNLDFEACRSFSVRAADAALVDTTRKAELRAEIDSWQP
ncbi:MAG: adenosine deaminase [Fimbriimonadaceae bacterium]|nr:adenosine deaminase [Fimbriimonadaceae bacterium]